MPRATATPPDTLKALHHKRVDASPSQLEEISAAIRVHFGLTEEASGLFEVDAGANGQAHYVAHSSARGRYGLKASVRGVPEGTEREVLVSHLAEVLQIPNAQRAHLCTRAALSFRSDLTFAIIPWLPGARSLDRIDDSEREHLRSEAADFARQFGEWMAFGLLCGVRDRHAGNWVWVPEGNRLAMIDMEDCLRSPAGHLEYSVFRDLLSGASDLSTALDAVRDGISAVLDKWQSSRALVAHLVAHAPFAAGYVSPYVGVAAADIFEPWVSDLGLRP